MYVGTDTPGDDRGLPRLDRIKWRGNAAIRRAIVAAMQGMHKDSDADARSRYSHIVCVVADGSGTEVCRPMNTKRRQLCYCFWKKETQLRYYVVVSMTGQTLFVSPPYPGKIDDCKILAPTGFYRW